jgi:hypothetical protein
MIDSVRRLLSDLFDYESDGSSAGALMATFFEWSEKSEEGRRIVVPSERLHELPSESKFEASIGVTARLASNQSAWEAQLSKDAELLNETANRCGWLSVDAYEVRLPKFLTMAQTLKDLSGFQDADVFVELVADGSLEDSLGQLADAEWPLAKYRSIGNTSESTSNLAFFIHSALALEVPFKLSGLLPSPITNSHGIGVLNAIGATALGIAHDLTRAEITDVLSSSNGTDWRVTDESLTWCGLEAGSDDLDDARAMLDGVALGDPHLWESELVRQFGS